MICSPTAAAAVTAAAAAAAAADAAAATAAATTATAAAAATGAKRPGARSSRKQTCRKAKEKGGTPYCRLRRWALRKTAGILITNNCYAFQRQRPTFAHPCHKT